MLVTRAVVFPSNLSGQLLNEDIRDWLTPGIISPHFSSRIGSKSPSTSGQPHMLIETYNSPQIEAPASTTMSFYDGSALKAISLCCISSHRVMLSLTDPATTDVSAKSTIIKPP